ncbi:phosphatase PAP2 family protein [Ramlibacter sp. PS4R-6]|uniref:phosphatase PAP2 family protein n=1 Tax=Ramlibacter sp. PS4R-6 TaxID=3133438 RepID=UPI0030A045A0
MRRAQLALAGGLLLFALAAADLLLHGPLTSVDPEISTWLHGRMHRAVTRTLLVFTYVHSTIGLSAMSAGLAIFFVVRRQPGWILRLLLTVQGGQLLNAGLKQLFQRARPHWDEPLLTFTTTSFPSGHAAGATVFWGFVCVAAWSLGAPPLLRRVLLVIAPLMVVLTCFSRVYLGAHYFSDVLAGVGEGVAWVAACTMLMRARTMRA